MKIDDSIKLHNMIKREGTETVIVRAKNKDNERKISIIPPWPKHIAWIFSDNSRVVADSVFCDT